MLLLCHAAKGRLTMTRLLTANVRWKADLATLGWKEEGSQTIAIVTSAYPGIT